MAWKSWDTPAFFGDKEIPKKLAANCQPIAIQGHIKDSKQIITTQIVSISLDGLECLNAKQIDEDCLDYEVRLCCKGKIKLIFLRMVNTHTNDCCKTISI